MAARETLTSAATNASNKKSSRPHSVPPPSSFPSHPRTASFVLSQHEHLEFYREQGRIHIERVLGADRARLETENAVKARARAAEGATTASKRREVPTLEGIKAVDLLGSIIASPGSTAAGTGPSSGSTTGRVRMVDQMKDKSGVTCVGSRGARKPRKSTTPSTLVVTRKELDLPKRATATTAFIDKENAPAAPAVPRASSPAPAGKLSRPAVTPLSSMKHPSKMAQPLQSDAHEPPRKRPRRASDDAGAVRIESPHSPTRSSSRWHPPPTSASKPAPAPSRRTTTQAPTTSDDVERAERLDERKSRRRAKAAIVKPKPRPPSSRSSEVTHSASPVHSQDSSAGHGRELMRKSAFARKGAGKKKKKPKKNADLGAPALGLGLMDNFRAANIGGGTSGRITLQRAALKLGVFNKGRASNRVRTSEGKKKGLAIGVPDLVFSEARFLSRPRPAPAQDPIQPTPYFSSAPSAHDDDSAHSPSPTPSSPSRTDRPKRVVPVGDASRQSNFFKSAVGAPTHEKQREQRGREAVYSPSWPDTDADKRGSPETAEGEGEKAKDEDEVVANIAGKWDQLAATDDRGKATSQVKLPIASSRHSIPPSLPSPVAPQLPRPSSPVRQKSSSAAATPVPASAVPASDLADASLNQPHASSTPTDSDSIRALFQLLENGNGLPPPGRLVYTGRSSSSLASVWDHRSQAAELDSDGVEDHDEWAAEVERKYEELQPSFQVAKILYERLNAGQDASLDGNVEELYDYGTMPTGEMVNAPQAIVVEEGWTTGPAVTAFGPGFSHIHTDTRPAYKPLFLPISTTPSSTLPSTSEDLGPPFYLTSVDDANDGLGFLARGRLGGLAVRSDDEAVVASELAGRFWKPHRT